MDDDDLLECDEMDGLWVKAQINRQCSRSNALGERRPYEDSSVMGLDRQVDPFQGLSWNQVRSNEYGEPRPALAQLLRVQ